MLRDLFGGQESSHIETGLVVENLLDGWYRVRVSGLVYTAKDQTGIDLGVGAVVSVATTGHGRFIVAGAFSQAVDIPTVIVRG